MHSGGRQGDWYSSETSPLREPETPGLPPGRPGRRLLVVSGVLGGRGDRRWRRGPGQRANRHRRRYPARRVTGEPWPDLHNDARPADHRHHPNGPAGDRDHPPRPTRLGDDPACLTGDRHHPACTVGARWFGRSVTEERPVAGRDRSAGSG